MKKMLFTSLALTMLAGIVFADEITRINKEQAATVAGNFYYERMSSKMPIQFDDIFIEDILIEYVKDEEVLYIVNIRGGGWIMVPAHASAPPVLAYSYSGTFTGRNVPPQLKDYLQSNKLQLSENIEKQIRLEKFKQRWSDLLTKEPENLQVFRGRFVEPLLTSSWDQGKYYNELCPADPAGPGGHCLTGCVATAMAQLMNYFRFPESGTGSYSYSCPPYGTLSADFSSANYNYNEMPLSVDYHNLSAAELLYHPGVSVDMVYGPDGSGMYNHKAAYSLRTYFKYSPETQYVYRDSTSMDWDSLIISHLDKEIPLYYAGWSVPNINGHAFICDGYEEPGYYHFNWGWSGSYDGYFYTDALNPGGSNFNLAQELIINAFPDTSNYTYPYYGNTIDTLKTTAGSIDDGSGPVYNYPNSFYRKWLIAPEDSVNFIRIEFAKFETESNDILTIYDGADTLSPILGSFSGTELPEGISSSGDKILVTFTSDNADNMKGFLLSYDSEIPVYCDGMTVFSSATETFSDGSGPRDYHNNSACLWNIQPENAGKVTLCFHEFNTEAGNDVMKVYDDGVLIATLSGETVPEPVIAHSGKMFITFSTNSSVTAPGWKAYYYANFTGTPENESPVANIYPVPASKWFRMDLPASTEARVLKIYSIDGRLIYNKKVQSNNIWVNTSDFEEGLYMVRMEGSKETIYKKLLIRH